MKRSNVLLLLALASLLVLTGCQSASEEHKEETRSGPVTSYGKAVAGAKAVGAELEERDEETRQQLEEMKREEF